ncbi:MAG: hypothetical protein J2P46_16075, partial [Zavarzinella sp.]|nr:hypothetical protein [Zavarzinella sp.]
FVPVLFGERPAGPWLWELHNEHRFPLPRLIYLGLFRLSGDLRTGCWVSFLGISLVAAGLVRLARAVRGRAHIADAVFPLLLMHTGQAENLYMGYQMAFMLTAALAAALLAVIVRTGEAGRFRRGLLATLIGWLLLTCGAAGLVYGIAAAGWVLYLAVRGRMAVRERIVLVVLAAVTPAYVAIYFQGYVRPSHHPPSAGFYESARVGLEAQAMALGPAATGLWPYVAIAILLVGCLVAIQIAVRLRSDQARAVGLLLFVGGAATVAFGIGWGRSGFLDDMGFAWRYGWVTGPAVWAAYFTWLICGGRVSVYGPLALFGVALILAPFNTASGFLDAEKVLRPRENAWEADARAGMSEEQLARTHYPDYGPTGQAEIREAVRLMRAHRYTYYESPGEEGS